MWRGRGEIDLEICKWTRSVVESCRHATTVPVCGAIPRYRNTGVVHVAINKSRSGKNNKTPADKAVTHAQTTSRCNGKSMQPTKKEETNQKFRWISISFLNLKVACKVFASLLSCRERACKRSSFKWFVMCVVCLLASRFCYRLISHLDNL